eukprot:CAMPEP_0183307704 /NCGR_PEP_ID=MMETSP0160_2-20130417/18847_1 /TAXON_ID=2839 ORGANISM="Odontella Sinensis, Strain Grunow 1884" /NCGR_SAMPLE_ID=MMETSP0160_2 /ASSEMBLY_ACC=CAM_ASM_000250 /LENGTH=76 /DNA_ID=CAMNT_0025471351 /DNA_START=279 /DNA_END=509 /DNA_ORIENTATION=+
MGNCLKSNEHSHLEAVDDSVHVMLKHDKKVQRQQGKPVTGYVPRAPHPSLNVAPNPDGVVSADEPGGGTEATSENT